MIRIALLNNYYTIKQLQFNIKFTILVLYIFHMRLIDIEISVGLYFSPTKKN